MTSEWEKLPEENKKEVLDAFISGYAAEKADGVIEGFEELLKDPGALDKIEDDIKRTEAYKAYIDRWLRYMLYTDNIEEKENLRECLEKEAKTNKNREVREAAKKALDTYYGRQ